LFTHLDFRRGHPLILAEASRHLAALADRCVRCGLCLPSCPTYRLARNEAEGPRGRIALIQGWAEGAIPASPALARHLDHCLECLACERACPSLVPFGDLMDGARALGYRRQPPWRRALSRLWLGALSSRMGARLAAGCGRIYRASGLATWIRGREPSRRWPGLAALLRLIGQCQSLPLSATPALQRDATLERRAGRACAEPAHPAPAWDSIPERCAGQPCSAPTHPAPPRGVTPEPGAPASLALFLGCIARTTQPGAIEASLRVLTWLGLDPTIPAGQGCCGALHRHNGLPAAADRRLRANAGAFAGQTAAGIASACVAELRTHPSLAKTQDLCRLLADLDWPPTAALRPLPLRVAVHVPCSQRNRLGDPEAAQALLRRIPDLELVDLPDNAFCCGAAGTYLLHNPAWSLSLLAPKLASLARLKVPLLVTTNTGCAMHLAAGIREAGLNVEVLHPVELIARQLPAVQVPTTPAMAAGRVSR